MKVLRPAPTPENWFIKEYCTGWGHSEKGCGAKLKVYREDLRYRPTTDAQEQGVTYKCLACGALNDIAWERFPPKYKELKPYKQNWIEKEETDG